MNFNSLIPDFNALKGIDYRKPVVDKSNTVALVALCAAVLGVIFVFLPWCKYSVNESEISRGFLSFGTIFRGANVDVSASTNLGITLWYGIFGFIFAAVAVAGVLYKQNALAFWAAVLCVILGLIGWLSLADCTMTISILDYNDITNATADEMKEVIDKKMATVNHIGAILFFFSGLVTAACTFMLATGKKVVLNVK